MERHNSGSELQLSYNTKVSVSKKYILYFEMAFSFIKFCEKFRVIRSDMTFYRHKSKTGSPVIIIVVGEDYIKNIQRENILIISWEDFTKGKDEVNREEDLGVELDYERAAKYLETPIKFLDYRLNKVISMDDFSATFWQKGITHKMMQDMKYIIPDEDKSEIVLVWDLTGERTEIKNSYTWECFFPNPEKIEAIEDIGEIVSKTEALSFLKSFEEDPS